jgi:flagellar hook-length control protein FliK
LVDQPAGKKTGRKFRSAKSMAKGDEQASQSHPAESIQQDTDGTVKKFGTTTVAAEQSQAGELLTGSEQATETEHGSEKADRESNARAAGRQRGDADAAAAKVAHVAANSVATQTREGPAGSESSDRAAQATKGVGAKADGLTDPAQSLHSKNGTARFGARSNGTDDMPRVDPTRFIGRVAKAFHTAQERGGTLQIRLSPPELGAMRLELTVKDGVMTAALETENASARRAVLEHLPMLRDRLAEQNIRIDRFDVDVRREGTNGQSDPRASQDGQPQQRQPERRQPALQQHGGTTARTTAPAVPPVTGNSGINLVA